MTVYRHGRSLAIANNRFLSLNLTFYICLNIIIIIIMYLYSTQYLHILQDSKRYLTHPAVQVQSQLTINKYLGASKIFMAVLFSFITPQPLMAVGVLFSPMVSRWSGGRPSGRVGGRREIVCPGCISETVRCRKLILGRDIG